MNILKTLVLFSLFALIACSPVSLPVNEEYQLSSFSAKKYVTKPHRISLLVTPVGAVSSYQTEEMLYVDKPFQLESFAKNAWKSPPADMLYPLMVESLQRSGYFYAITTNLYSEHSDYRLDTELLKLEQNFLSKPSTIQFSVKVVLTHVEDNLVLGSRIMSYSIPCERDTPYGGVLAANKASQQFTAAVTDFVISQLR